MKKPELINEMVKAKHIGNFKHIKAKGAKPTPKATPKPDIRKSKPTAAVLKIKEQIKKQADKIKADRAKAKPAPKAKPAAAPKKRVKKPLTVTTADGKKTVIKKKAKPAKLKIPSITISEVPKEKKPKRKEIKSSLGKIPAPKVRIRVAPKKAKAKAKPAKKKDVIDSSTENTEKIRNLQIKLRQTKDKEKREKIKKKIKKLQSKQFFEPIAKQAPKAQGPKITPITDADFDRLLGLTSEPPKAKPKAAPKAAPKKKEEKKKAPVDKDLRKRLAAKRKAAADAPIGGGGARRDQRSAEAKERERLEALKPKEAKAKDVELNRAEYSKADMLFGFTRTKIKKKMKNLKTSKEMKEFLKDFKAAKTKGLLSQLVDAGYTKKSSLKFVKEEQIPTFKLSLEQILEEKKKEEGKN